MAGTTLLLACGVIKTYQVVFGRLGVTRPAESREKSHGLSAPPLVLITCMSSKTGDRFSDRLVVKYYKLATERQQLTTKSMYRVTIKLAAKKKRYSKVLAADIIHGDGDGDGNEDGGVTSDGYRTTIGFGDISTTYNQNPYQVRFSIRSRYEFGKSKKIVQYEHKKCGGATGVMEGKTCRIPHTKLRNFDSIRRFFFFPKCEIQP